MGRYKNLKRRILTKYAHDLFNKQVMLDLGIFDIHQTLTEKLNSFLVSVAVNLIVSKNDLEMVKDSAWDEAEQYPGYISWIDIAINDIVNPETNDF